MTRRFIDSDILALPWFVNLPPEAKLLMTFLYLDCDCAGFWRVNLTKVSELTGLPMDGTLHNEKLMTVQDSLEELRGQLLWRNDGEVLFLPMFLHDQGNWPLVPNRNCHTGILRRFDAWGEFGVEAYKAVTAVKAEQRVSDLFYAHTKESPGSLLGGSKGRVQRDPLSRSNDISKKGVQGETCRRCESLGRRSRGVHLRTDDTGHNYYLCEKCASLTEAR